MNNALGYPGTVAVLTSTIEQGDADTIAIQVRASNGTITPYTISSPEVAHPSDGVYVTSIPCDRGGTWKYRFVANGDEAGADEYVWRILESGIT